MKLSRWTLGLGLAASVAATAQAATISRVERRTTYEPTNVAASVKNGVLPAAIYGQPYAGATPDQVAAALVPPGWLANTRIGTGAERGVRLVLVFNPAVPVEADTLCAAPEQVATMPSTGDLRVQGAWCFSDKAASRGFAVGGPVSSASDPELRDTVSALLVNILPSGSWPPDQDNRPDFLP
jgi:hypothetical protein